VNALCPLLYYSGQEYAQVVKMLGNGRCECFCFDGVTRLGHIRGKMRKKVWITAGDIVLVGKRDFQDEKVDIVHKYSADEARNLKQYGELPETARINETAVDMAMAGDDDDADLGIDFDDMYVFVSRAFRNRFVEIQVNDIPSKEMVTTTGPTGP